MKITKEYKEGVECYRRNGDDLTRCKYQVGTQEHEDFCRGFFQEMKRCDVGRPSNSVGRDMWSIREELEKARQEKLVKEKSERDKERKRKKYLRESRGEY